MRIQAHEKPVRAAYERSYPLLTVQVVLLEMGDPGHLLLLGRSEKSRAKQAGATTKLDGLRLQKCHGF